MSRYQVETLGHHHLTILVGWDNPLQTYWAQAWDPQLKETDDSGCIFWVGTDLGSVRTVSDLAQVISGYATLPEKMMKQLEQDQAESERPIPLQQWVTASLGPETLGDDQEREVVTVLHDHRCVICGVTTTSRCQCDTPNEATYCDQCDEIPF